MLVRSQLAVAIGMMTLAGVIIIIVYVRMIKHNTDRFSHQHPKSDTERILQAIEGNRQQTSSTGEQIIAEVKGVRSTVAWIKARWERFMRL